jgi:hypothetical protein
MLLSKSFHLVAIFNLTHSLELRALDHPTSRSDKKINLIFL